MSAQDTPRYPHLPETQQEGPGYQPRTLVLLGASLAHIHVLATLAAQPLIGVQVVLVAPQPHHVHTDMVVEFVAGHRSANDCTIPLEPLVRQSGVRWLQRNVKTLDAPTQLLQLDDGSTLHYDWLSISTDPTQNREQIDQRIPGARENGLFVRPIDAFLALWPQVAAMGDTRALRVAVLGAGTAGTTLALAVRQRLPKASVTLISGVRPPGVHYPPPVQQRLQAMLKQRQITILQDTAIGVSAGEVRLACGAGLACDVPLIALGAHPPSWLAASGLALDAQGCMVLDANQRSSSHPQVFAAAQELPLLAHNLAAAATGKPLQTQEPATTRLHLWSCGHGQAIASWGSFSAQGRWVWWLKRWLDHRVVARYSRRTEPSTP